MDTVAIDTEIKIIIIFYSQHIDLLIPTFSFNIHLHTFLNATFSYLTSRWLVPYFISFFGFWQAELSSIALLHMLYFLNPVTTSFFYNSLTWCCALCVCLRSWNKNVLQGENIFCWKFRLLHFTISNKPLLNRDCFWHTLALSVCFCLYVCVFACRNMWIGFCLLNNDFTDCGKGVVFGSAAMEGGMVSS